MGRTTLFNPVFVNSEQVFRGFLQCSADLKILVSNPFVEICGVFQNRSDMLNPFCTHLSRHSPWGMETERGDMQNSG